MHKLPSPIHNAKRHFYERLFRNVMVAFLVISFSLFIGMCGYHYIEKMSWLDAYLNASMILAGMGPVGAVETSLGKFFAGTYALFSGIVFLIAMAIILAPALHYFLHKFHMAEEEAKNSKKE